MYTGCPHRCYYCFAPNVLHREREVFHSCVEPRKDIVRELRRQLEREQITGKLIHLAGLANYIVKSPIGGKAWTASKNLVDPEPRTRDERISGRKARELAENIQDNTRFEKLYPGYLMSAAEAFHNDVNGGCYLVARFYRKDEKFIKPKKPKQKRRNREGRKHT